MAAGNTGFVGGLVGVDEAAAHAITQSYATGAVSGLSFTGGLIGRNFGASVSASYWDTQTTGQPTSAGGTSKTTSALQGALPAGFDSTVWSTGTGLYPFLTNFFPNGLQAISGTAYKDAGLTPVASNANGAATVTGIANGAAFGAATTGANGDYYLFGPAGSFTTGDSLLTYTTANVATGATNAATLATATGALDQTGVNLYGAAVTVPTSALLLSTAPTLAAAQTSALAADGGDSAAAAAINAATGRGLNASGASFTVDQTVSTGATLYIQTGAGEPLTVADAVTINATGSLGLVSGGALNIDAPVTVTGAGGVNLGYAPSSPTNLGFDLTGAGFLGSLTFASGFSQKLDINGAVYTLLYTAAQVQALNASSGALQGNYALANSLDAASVAGWVPIGTNGTGTALNGGLGFSGVFTGLGHTISNLSVTTVSNWAGPFGYSTGAIRDIGIVGGSVTLNGGASLGGLVGQTSGPVTDAFATDTVSGSGSAYLGGLVGYATGSSITDAFATGAVTANSGNTIGGLVGFSASTITDAYATGAVTGNGDAFVGGLVGQTSGGSITDAYAMGAVVANSGEFVGGLVGEAVGGSITDAYATGAVVVGGGVLFGGLVGANPGASVTDGYYDTSTTGQSVSAGGTGKTTAQLQGALPTLANAVWSTGPGLYPYLTNFFPNGVQAISGTAYSSSVVKAVAAQIGIYSGGAELALGTASSGANGYFYEIVPAGTLPSTGVDLGETIALSGAAAVSGLHYADGLAFAGAPGSQLLSGTSVNSGLYLEQTSETLDSALLTDLRATFGTANFAALNTTLATTPLNLQAAGAFTVDGTFSRTGALQIEANGDLTISAAGSAASSASGDALVLSANGNFINDAGSSAVVASNASGRWLIYSQLHGGAGAAPTGDVFDGLTAKNYFGDLFTFGPDRRGPSRPSPTAATGSSTAISRP